VGRLALQLTSKRLNDYVSSTSGRDFTAKDFRTWGGTLLAAVALAEHAQKHGFPETATDEKPVARQAPLRTARNGRQYAAA